MSDDRYTFVHARLDSVRHLAEDDFSFDLPDEDIDVPSHLVPLYQDEEDDSVLPTNSHPSYPYGNPYRITPASKLATPFPTSHRSLATSLPSLYLSRHHGPSAKWTDYGIDRVLPYEPPQEHVTAPSAIPEEPRGPAANGAGQAGGGGTGEQTRSREVSPASTVPMEEERAVSLTPSAEL